MRRVPPRYFCVQLCVSSFCCACVGGAQLRGIRDCIAPVQADRFASILHATMYAEGAPAIGNFSAIASAGSEGWSVVPWLQGCARLAPMYRRTPPRCRPALDELAERFATGPGAGVE